MKELRTEQRLEEEIDHLTGLVEMFKHKQAEWRDCFVEQRKALEDAKVKIRSTNDGCLLSMSASGTLHPREVDNKKQEAES